MIRIGQAQIAAANTSRACSLPRYIRASLGKVQSGKEPSRCLVMKSDGEARPSMFCSRNS
jgi:hypothetical protein